MSERPQVHHAGTGDIGAIDRRSHTVRSLPGTGMPHVTREISDGAGGAPVAAAHSYDEFVIPDELPVEQCAAEGLELVNAGPVADRAPDHRHRSALVTVPSTSRVPRTGQPAGRGPGSGAVLDVPRRRRSPNEGSGPCRHRMLPPTR
ncbi:hypothetical protein [Streptomyces albospinus]|uniref:hypothetical protein n=1 Tax=Streptomyces albospinus TaxID=285515 RepID=UPI00167048D0|nr:hypothetical protein [Streptomyces albospinus]